MCFNNFPSTLIKQIPLHFTFTPSFTSFQFLGNVRSLKHAFITSEIISGHTSSATAFNSSIVKNLPSPDLSHFLLVHTSFRRRKGSLITPSVVRGYRGGNRGCVVSQAIQFSHLLTSPNTPNNHLIASTVDLPFLKPNFLEKSPPCNQI